MKPEKSVHSYFSDTILLDHLKQGDRLAFVEIFDRHWKKVYNECYKRLKNADLVESIVQEVYVTLWIEKESDKVQDLLPYLLSSLRYRILSLYRDGKAGPFFENGINYFISTNLKNGIN